MSSNNNTNSNKAFCKVCKDAGCPETQYTSHFVKDQPGPNGKVVCPTLLNQSCRICNQTGHTSSYCKQYKPRPSREEPRHQEPRREELRHQEHRDYRRDDYRHQEPRDYRRDDYRHQEPRRDDYRREEPRDYRREEPRHQEPRHEETQRRAPYAHPHGPRVRLQLEARALSAPSPAPSVLSAAQPTKRVILVNDEELSRLPITEIDVRKVDLKAEPVWADEPLVDMAPEHRRILEDEFMKCLISDKDFDLIVAADEDNMAMCGRNN